MIDIKFLRENPEAVKENIRKKFQFQKLPMVDEVIAFDKERREIIGKKEALQSQRNKISKEIGKLMGQGKKDEAEKVKAEVADINKQLPELEARDKELEAEIRKRMLVIPNIIDPSVPIGEDDTHNVELEPLSYKNYGVLRRH